VHLPADPQWPAGVADGAAKTSTRGGSTSSAGTAINRTALPAALHQQRPIRRAAAVDARRRLQSRPLLRIDRREGERQPDGDGDSGGGGGGDGARPRPSARPRHVAAFEDDEALSPLIKVLGYAVMFCHT